MSENEPSRRRGYLLPVVLTAAAVGLAGLYVAVEDNPFRRPALAFSIRFDDVTGVREHSKVMFLGIPVGYVTGLRYEPRAGAFAVKVDVAVTRPLPIPADVVASLEPTLLGEASIALRPAATPPVPADSRPEPPGLLADGAEILGRRATKLEAVVPGFDAALATVQELARATGERLSEAGEVVDRSLANLNALFLQPDADGKTPSDRLVATLQGLVDGPAGDADGGLRGELQAIIANLRASSDNVRKLADLQAKEPGGVGHFLMGVEDAAAKFRDDAVAAQRLIAKLGRTSDAVAQAGAQVNTLAAQATQTVEDFRSRPMHFLTTTRAPATPKAPRVPGDR